MPTTVQPDSTPAYSESLPAPLDGETASAGDYRAALKKLLNNQAVLRARPTPTAGTRAQRLALTPTPTVVTAWLETDTHLPLTYYPGVGWRDAFGSDPDAPESVVI